MKAALLVLLAALAAPPPDRAECEGRLCFAEALTPFLAELKASEESGAPVHILQIGDSHTAGDMITNAWRRRLQARYGNGGRGMLAAGHPYAGYLTWGVTAGQTAGWSVNAGFGSSYLPAGPPLGLAGFTQTAGTRGETLTLTADSPDSSFDRLIVCALARPGAGIVELRIGETAQNWSLDAPASVPACRTLESPALAMMASLTVEEEGPVAITSFSVFRRGGGVALSNVGIVGAQLSHLGRTDDRVAAAELEAYRPNLIVLAFGTNEGFSPSLSLETYEATLREQVLRLRRLAGRDVPILLLGAPDAATRQPPSRRANTACGDGWFVPGLLEEVRERQVAVARDLGLAYWRWSAAMGGRCASSSWTRAGLMRPDHVHFTPEGGARIGAMIDADIGRAVEARH
jgi:lysophospholipase L1-like esterase